MYYSFRKIKVKHENKTKQENQDFEVYISQRFRLYNERKDSYNETNLKFLYAGADKMDIPLKGGVYFIYSNKKLIYIGYGGEDVLRALKRHFHKYNDRNKVTRVQLEKSPKYSIQILIPINGVSPYFLEKFFINKYKPEQNTNLYSSEFDADINEKSFKEIKAEIEKSQKVENDLQKWFYDNNVSIDIDTKGNYVLPNADNYTFEVETEEGKTTYTGQALNDLINEFKASFVPF